MKFYVDPDVCISCGLCPEKEEAVFRMNDEGKAEAYQEATQDNKESAIDAMESCPVEAISEA